MAQTSDTPRAGREQSDSGVYAMNEVMTVSEIHAAFPSEWVLIGDPVTDQYNHVQSGEVLCHNTNRDVVYKKAIEAPCELIAVLYTGPIPAPGTAILL